MKDKFLQTTPVIPIIGIGILAGLIGTIAMSVSKKAVESVTGNKQKNATVEAVKKVFNIHPEKENKKAFSNAVIYGYGSMNGIVRSLLSFAKIKGSKATAIHFGIISAMVVVAEPLLKVSPPLSKRNPARLAVGLLHHAVYAVVTGFVFDTGIKKLN